MGDVAVLVLSLALAKILFFCVCVFKNSYLILFQVKEAKLIDESLTVLSKNPSNSVLVGGFNPVEKYARQIGSFPQNRGENSKKSLKPPPRVFCDLHH